MESPLLEFSEDVSRQIRPPPGHLRCHCLPGMPEGGIGALHSHPAIPPVRLRRGLGRSQRRQRRRRLREPHGIVLRAGKRDHPPPGEPKAVRGGIGCHRLRNPQERCRHGCGHREIRERRCHRHGHDRKIQPEPAAPIPGFGHWQVQEQGGRGGRPPNESLGESGDPHQQGRGRRRSWSFRRKVLVEGGRRHSECPRQHGSQVVHGRAVRCQPKGPNRCRDAGIQGERPGRGSPPERILRVQRGSPGTRHSCLHPEELPVRDFPHDPVGPGPLRRALRAKAPAGQPVHKGLYGGGHRQIGRQAGRRHGRRGCGGSRQGTRGRPIGSAAARRRCRWRHG
mmetsp:Transcript_20163/g.41837  ORF Transcript_20163/g.41837 Transcript_20163/m.41837 type:complete len:338 (-) Transcript_20163:2555-3568(-)